MEDQHTDSAAEHSMERLLDASSDGVDMNGAVTIASTTTVFRGPIFTVDDVELDLPLVGGGTTRIRRQIIRHAP